MEPWQAEIINRKGEALTTLIFPNTSIIAALGSVDLLSTVEQRELVLNEMRLPFGEMATVGRLLTKIVSKKETKEEGKPPRAGFDAFLDILETHVQTGAHALLKAERDAYLRKNASSSNTPTNKTTTGTDCPDASICTKLKKEYLGLAKRDQPLDVKVDDPTEDMTSAYKGAKLISGDKGSALIINIKDFPIFFDASGNKIDNTRGGSEYDVKYMIELWRQLGYKIFREEEVEDQTSWTKKEVMDIIEAFQNYCNKKKPESAIIFIGSHGENGYIYTSDSTGTSDSKINLKEEIFAKFYDEACPGLKGNLKLFLINACQIFREAQSDDTKIKGAVVSDMIVCTSQAPGYSSFRSVNSGSWFVHCLTYYIMKCASNIDLWSILNWAYDAVESREGSINDGETGTEPSNTPTFFSTRLSNPKIYFSFKK